MKKTNLILLSTMLLSVNAFSQDKAKEVKQPAIDYNAVVATVNGVEINRGQLEQAYEQNMLFVSDKMVTKEKVLTDIINKEIGTKRAYAEKLNEDPIVKAKMEEVMYHALISKDLESKLSKIEVTEKEAQDYYSKHKEYRTAHILLRIRVVPQKEETEEALKRAMEIYKELKAKPQNWPELANKYSQSSAALSGGDIGFQPAIKLAPEYFAAINEKKVGYITPPTRTQFGVHVIKVLGVHEWKDVDPALYKKIVYDQKRDKILEDYFEAQRKSAQIKINKEFLKQ